MIEATIPLSFFVQLLREIRGDSVAQDALADAKLPLVIVSHGRGAWFGANHDTEEALADAGFVVAAINHPGDSF